MQRQRHQEFIRLLDAIEAAVPAGKLIALPPDQGPDKMIADVPLSLRAKRSNLPHALVRYRREIASLRAQ